VASCCCWDNSSVNYGRDVLWTLSQHRSGSKEARARCSCLYPFEEISVTFGLDLRLVSRISDSANVHGNIAFKAYASSSSSGEIIEDDSQMGSDSSNPSRVPVAVSMIANFDDKVQYLALRRSE